MCQVEWLGRVLANRGIPRIAQERQLELFYEELTSAISTENVKYERLLKAAASLKAERLRMILKAKSNELVQQFHLAADCELRGRLQGTGSLIVSAVVDEALGMSKAVSSLLVWLTDADRFSSQWIAAVIKTAECSRRDCAPISNGVGQHS